MRPTDLATKIEVSLNECRTLLLGIEIFMGFGFGSVYRKPFSGLDPQVRLFALGGLGAFLLASSLLGSPITYHKLVEHSHDTPRLINYINWVIMISLVLFSIGIGFESYVAVFMLFGEQLAIFFGSGSFLLSIVFWFALEAYESIIHRKEIEKDIRMGLKAEHRVTRQAPLEDLIEQALIETRIILPGVQALLGFQLAIILLSGFRNLPKTLQLIHLVSMAMIVISMILLMTPPAYHRIVDRGQDTQRFLKFTSRVILISMIFLAIGLDGDFYIVVINITGIQILASSLFGLVLVGTFALWFGMMYYFRYTSAKEFEKGKTQVGNQGQKGSEQQNREKEPQKNQYQNKDHHQDEPDDQKEEDQDQDQDENGDRF